MRILTTIAFSAFFAMLTAALVEKQTVTLCITLCIAAGVIGALFHKKKKAFSYLAVIGLTAAVAMAYFAAYDGRIAQPVRELDGETAPFAGTVCEWPTETTYGAKVTVKLTDYPHAKAIYYGDADLLELQPGQILRGEATWHDAGHIHDTDVTSFNARGVYALLYEKGDVTAEQGSTGRFRWWPQQVSRAAKEKINTLWQGDAAAVIMAELTGDKSGMSDELYAAVKDVGLAHIFAVSGLHCAFLVSIITLLVPRQKRKISFAVLTAVLLFYAAMVGFTPSVVRACVMQAALLAAPLFKRESDGLTALGGALLLIILLNPYAVFSISLQLSFAATLGILLFTPRIYGNGWYGGKNRLIKRVVSFAAANVSASLGALVLTIPLTVYYFQSLTLIAPLSNFAALWAASWNFISAFLTTALGFVWPWAARWAAEVSGLLVQYLLRVVRLLQKIPYHTLSFENAYLYIWLAYAYALLGDCLISRNGKRKYVTAALLAVVGLIAAVQLGTAPKEYGAMSVSALDVGQGESVLLTCGDGVVLVDCGSSNSYVHAGTVAAQTMGAMGIYHLDAVAVTHYHADHTNGLRELLGTVLVDTLYLPDIEDDYGVRDTLVSLAEKKGIDVQFVTELTAVPVGEGTLTVFPPIGKGDMNEMGLSVLASAEDFDVLITGDMDGATECALAETYALPDIEVLLVSHHGSKYGSSSEFLALLRPETAIISVGDNSNGHPTREAIGRLQAAGAAVYRTDENGTVTVTAKGGEEGGV